VALGTSTQPSHLVTVHLALLVTVSMALPSHPSENYVFYPSRALVIRNLVLNLVCVRRVFLFTPSLSISTLKHTHRRRRLVEGAQGTAVNGKGVIRAAGHHHPHQILLSSSNSIYSPVTPGGLTSPYVHTMSDLC
jgi:hypothetical protein